VTPVSCILSDKKTQHSFPSPPSILLLPPLPGPLCARAPSPNNRLKVVKTEARNTPKGRDHRHRACREGSWEGGGVLLALGTASCLVKDTTCQRDGNVIVVTSFLVAGGSIFNLWERQTPSFCDVVARASDTPIPTGVNFD
jgi:hypothetical protein